MANKYCSQCKEKLENGEVVAISSEGVYHSIARDLYEVPIDCSMKKAMEGVSVFERKVYYEGNFYNISKVENLHNADELTFEFNEKNTGDIIKGDLKGLTKKLFGIF